jgi:hypothetical protein
MLSTTICIRRGAVVLVGLIVGGCSQSPSAPTPVGVQFKQLPDAGDGTAIVSFEPDHRAIRLNGRFSAAACGELGAAVEQRGTTINVRIVPRSDVCELSRTPHAYEALLVGLEAGSYHVRVTHEHVTQQQREFFGSVTVRRW